MLLAKTEAHGYCSYAFEAALNQSTLSTHYSMRHPFDCCVVTGIMVKVMDATVWLVRFL